MRYSQRYLPSVVLSIEQEVSTYYGNTHSNDDHDYEYKHHESIDIVDLIGPERCEDEVPTNEINNCSIHVHEPTTPKLYFFNSTFLESFM